MVWKVRFYQTYGGDKVVKEFFKGLQKNTQAKTFRYIDLLEEHGPHLGMPYSKKIRKDIFELRVSSRQNVRILYTFSRGEIYLLHAFKKQTNKIPKREIKITEERNNALTKI